MRRSSQQIYNVTIFFVFFMCLYGLLGVQLFGELNHHCIRKGNCYTTKLILKRTIFKMRILFQYSILIYIVITWLGVKPEEVTKDDLTIPDSFCNPKNDKNSSDGSSIVGHKCPPMFECRKLSVLGSQKLGFIGFGNFATSVFSVYTG